NFADGILMINKENKLSLINPKAEELLGIKEKEIKNKKIKELNGIPSFNKIFDEVGEEIKAVFRKEVKIDENLILEVSVIPLIRREEQLGVLVTLHDITRQKGIQKMKTEFVSVAAHQLRTPLSAIKWTLEMLLEGDVGELTEEQNKFLKKSFKSNERMINLINDLLNVSRIEEGRYLYERKKIKIKKIIDELIKNHEEDLKRKDINLEFNKTKEKINFAGDKEKIRLAIQNLIDNAVKYTLKGGKIVVNLKKKDKNSIKFSIEDDGIGIPKKQHSRIFSKFFRGKTAVRRETEGSGLGLFITKNIIEAHGGEIWFESEEGEGTTFYFTLPLLKPEED
ncbi:MAG: sensor histidine kinase, partial [Nanoarchaeota archaeon]